MEQLILQNRPTDRTHPNRIESLVGKSALLTLSYSLNMPLLNVFTYWLWLMFYIQNIFALTPWGLGTWNVTNPRDWALFGDFFKIFFIKPVFYLSWQPILLIIHYTSRAHVPLTTINFFFFHHQVHDALNAITMTPPWCYNRGTYMSFQSLNKGWTYMSFQTSKD